MADSYRSLLRTIDQVTGENDDTWGDKADTNFDIFERAIAGYVAIDAASADVTLTESNGALDQNHYAVIKLTGTLAGNRNINTQDEAKNWVFWDATTHSGNTLTIKTVSGTGVTMAEGEIALVASDGTNIIKLLSTLFDIVNDTTPQLGGQLDVNGQAIGDGTLELLTFTETGSAVNQLNVTNAATGNGPILSVAGDDSDADLNLRSLGTGNIILADDSGNEILIANDVASAVNEVTVENAVAGEAPEIQATGDDTNIGLDLITKGSGPLLLNTLNLVTLSNIQAFTADGTWTQPDDQVTRVFVIVIGPGGGGGSGDASNGGAGGGGGGAAIELVTGISGNVTVTVGTGGAGGTGGAAGSDGSGSSSFGAFCSAGEGGGGNGAGGSGGAGGGGSGGTVNMDAADGLSHPGDGNNRGSQGGYPPIFGGGGQGGNSDGQLGADGGNYGGGGGGGGQNADGGDGADGIVVVIW